MPKKKVIQGGGIIVYDDAVVLRRNKAGKWIFPKGHVDPGETTAQTALREAEEETGLLLWFAWNVLVLASIQLTVRLILAFSVRTTLLGALAFTLGSLPIAALYRYILERSLVWYPLVMVLSGLLGYAVARWVLRIRR